MDISKTFCNGEGNFFFEVKERRKVSCIKIFCYRTDPLETQHLLEILQTLLTLKSSEKVVKSECFEKLLRWRAPIVFRNEGGI